MMVAMTAESMDERMDSLKEHRWEKMMDRKMVILRVQR